ncbi:hypothetical protein ElyMa_003053000 [Elysia marginata]|uniref:Uncharacterized protein n=1 Tax=Elysia marginata TaxID=1093978 RepID=A0AAV4INL8_9GAST|nr:hypothetical protein ElyMa_003053000 [Elysia marginata]
MELEPVYHPDYVLENLDFFGDSNDTFASRTFSDNSSSFCNNNNIFTTTNNINNNNNINSNGINLTASGHFFGAYTERERTNLSAMPKHKNSFYRSVSMRLPNLVNGVPKTKYPPYLELLARSNQSVVVVVVVVVVAVVVELSSPSI